MGGMTCAAVVQSASEKCSYGKRAHSGHHSQGETVPYVICVEVGADGQAAAGGAHGKGLAQRAYHPDEIRAADGRLALDVEYYLAQQACPASCLKV